MSTSGTTSGTTTPPPNPYASGITLPGVAANNGSYTYKTVWDPATGTYAINQGADGALAPIFSASQWDQVQKGLAPNEKFSGSVAAPGTQPAVPHGRGTGNGNVAPSLTIYNKGGGDTQVGYRLDPKTGDYVPVSSQGIGQDSWWQSQGFADLALGAVAAVTGGAALGAFGAADAAGAAAATGAADAGVGAAAADAAGGTALTTASAGGFDAAAANASFMGSVDAANAAAGTAVDASGASIASTMPDVLAASTAGAPSWLTAAGNLVGSGVNAITGGGSAGGIAGLAGGLYAANQAKKDSQTYANEYKALAQPAGAIANQAAQEYTTGQLQPWQQAQIDQMTQQEKAQGAQFLSNSGQGTAGQSTTSLGINQQIDTNALVQHGQFVQQAFSDFLQSDQQYANIYGQGIQAEMTGDKEVMDLWNNILGGMAKASASGGGSSGGGGGIGGIISSGIQAIGNIFS